ncbi:MAG TPA: putative Ig domain-containing protein [Usitatibacter sp.]|nr:putative Ig domain-containing protein [Usitatibacter sp.]
MARVARLFLLVALFFAAILSLDARAECGGSVQCISIGRTPGEADTNHHGGGSSTFTMAFGSQAVGTTSAAQTAYVAAVTGPAGSMADLGIIFIDGADAASFVITGGTCSDTNGPVHNGSQCTITVAFNPLSAGAKTATVHVPVDPPICAGCITERSFTVTGTGASPPPVITSPLTATGTVNVAFAGYQITATNSPTSFGASGLPAGLSINGSGFISGTPTTAGTFNSTITATNASGADSKTLVFTIHPPAPAITSPNTATGTGGQPFSYQITASNSPTSFGATGLPAGVSVNTSTGLVSGTPTQGGTFNATVSATNVSGTGTQPVTITINLVAPVITSSSSASGTGGQPFSFQVTAGNLPSSFSASGLPAGLSIDTASGLISGTPTVTGTFTVTVNATNSAGTGTQTLTLTLNLAPPAITSPGSAAASLGSPFSYQITASNLPASFGASGLPPGLSVDTGSGLVSGTPTSPGSFNATISASNAAGTGSQALTINVAGGPPAITSAATASGIVGQAFSYQITATNFATSFGATGLPPGLSVATSTGLISGTPTAPGSYSATITASNAAGTGSQALSITITLLPPAITSALSANGFVGQAFSYQIAASNSPTSFGASGLPPGLTLNTGTGLISGTPTTGGVFPVALTATNAAGTGSATLSIAIGNVPGPAAGNRSVSVPFNAPTAIDLAPFILNAFTSVEIVSGPSQGTATVSGSVVTYTPRAGYLGTDSFVYTATGPGGTSAPATITITVLAPPAPTVSAIDAVTSFETPVRIELAGAVSGIYATLAIATLPDRGLLTLEGTTATYTPAAGFFGEDSFTFTATGPGGTSAPARVRITVGTVAPTAGAATMTVPLNTATTLDLRPFIRGSGITRIAITSQPARGRAIASGTSVTYTPNRDVFGSDAFSYVAIGNAGSSTAAIVSVTIVGRPDPTRDPSVTGLLESQSNAAQRFSAAQIANVQRRMESLHRGAPPAAGNLAAAPMLASLATTGTLELAALGGTTLGVNRERANVWVGGLAQFGRRDADGSLAGLDFTTRGLTVGVDRRIGRSLVVGAGAGMARDRADVGSDGTHTRARGVSAVAYASFQPGANTFVDAMVGGGRLEFESQRFVAPLDAMLSSDRHGRQLFGSLAAGYEHRRNGVVLSPYGRLDYSRDRIDAGTEAGGAPYALAYSGQTASWLSAAAGIRAEATIGTRFGWTTPRLRAEYRRHLRGDRATDIAYADLLDGPRFSFSGRPADRDAFVLGLGTDLVFRGGLTVGLEYQVQRAGAGESDQLVRLNITQELAGTGSLRWLDGLFLEATRPLDLQLDAGFTFDDNVSRALSAADRRHDRSFSANARLTRAWGVSRNMRAVATASLGGEKFQYHNGLSRATGGVKGELQYRPSAAFGAPTLALFGQAATEQYESRLRDGERYGIGASMRLPVTDRIGLFGTVFHQRREARSHVFDGRENGARVNLDWALGQRATFYLSGEHRRGDHVTSANPLGEHIAFKHDEMPHQVIDDAFRGPDLTTARFEGRSWLAGVGFNYALGPRDAIDFSWRRVRTKPDDPADVVIGFYAPVPPVRYTVNQFFVLYLLSF